MSVILIRVVTFGLIVYAVAGVLLYATQDRFLFPAPQQRSAPAPGFEEVTLETDDRLSLTAHWQAPLTGKPSVVWFHGNASSLQGSAAETALLASRGYGLLLVSYRGYGGNSGRPSENGFYRDGRAAMAFLEKSGVAREQTIIAGNSIGSGTAVEMAKTYDPAALILIAPFASLTDVASDAIPWLPVRWLLQHRFENAEKLSQLDLPVLILHGTGDKVVPLEQGKKLAAVARQGTFQEFDGVGHELSLQINAQRAQAAWLRELGL